MQKILLVSTDPKFTECHVAMAHNNRPLDPKHILKLEASIKADGYFDGSPITYTTGTKADQEGIEYRFFKAITKGNDNKIAISFYAEGDKPDGATPENTYVIPDGQHRFAASQLAEVEPIFVPIPEGMTFMEYTAKTGNLSKPWDKQNHLVSLGNRATDELLRDIRKETEDDKKGSYLALLELCTMDSEKSITLTMLTSASLSSNEQIDDFISSKMKLNETNVKEGIEIYKLIRDEESTVKLSTSSRLTRAIKSSFDRIRNGGTNAEVYNVLKWLFSGSKESQQFVQKIKDVKKPTSMEYEDILLEASLSYNNN